jgi:hypothetical protein
MAAFEILGESLHRRLQNVQHVRPGEADAATLSAALAAFQEIIRKGLETGMDCAIQVDATDFAQGPQYCLVVFNREFRRVIGATAFIVRCADQERAVATMSRARLLLQQFGSDGDAAAVPA